MYKVNLLLYAIIVSIFACSPAKTQNNGYSNKNIELKSDRITPELLWQLGRIGNVSISPDESEILYTVTYTNIAKNKSYSDIYVMNIDGTNQRQLTSTATNEYAVKWHPDGQTISFLSAESGSSQLWEINKDGSERKQISSLEQSIDNYAISPDGKKLMYTSEVKIDQDIHDAYPDLPLANARIENDLMYRHWDTWEDGKYSHVFITTINDNKTVDNNGIDIIKGERFDSPLKPFGGSEQITWSPDSKNVVYVCKKLVGKAYALSTNSDLYQYNLDTKQTSNLTEGMMGYDINPQFSNDGNYIAWESMERNGYESDKNRLFIMNVATQEKSYLTKSFDQNVNSFEWTKDNKSISFISNYHGCNQIYLINIKSQKISQITNSIQNYNSASVVKKQIIATKTKITHPTEIFSVNIKNGEDKNLSKVNSHILSQIKLGKVESRWIETTDGKQMQTWVIYPPDFDENKKYPTLLYCQGGPQSTISQYWSLRWNFELMSANDYIIVAPNRRGLPGFGQEWNEQISGDYGGQNMKDYLSAIDAMAKEPYVDENRLGAIGASYGGFSVYWLAGNHNKRFKTFIAHCGIFNFDQMYATTEEMFFVNWDMKGAYWDKDNAAAQKTYANSPHKFVNNWDTPILVIHGEKDFRIPYTQGMGAFNTAILKGIPARFLYFPTECHWVLSPQNGILWHREFFKWLDETLKK